MTPTSSNLNTDIRDWPPLSPLPLEKTIEDSTLKKPEPKLENGGINYVW